MIIRHTRRGLAGAGAFLLVALATPVLAAPTPAPGAPGAAASESPMLEGIVTSIDASRIVVNGTTYTIDGETAFEDMGTAVRINPARIKAGMTVYLEIDDGGRLRAVRAHPPG